MKTEKIYIYLNRLLYTGRAKGGLTCTHVCLAKPYLKVNSRRKHLSAEIRQKLNKYFAKMRNLECTKERPELYNICLDIAAEKKWQGFFCCFCPVVHIPIELVNLKSIQVSYSEDRRATLSSFQEVEIPLELVKIIENRG